MILKTITSDNGVEFYKGVWKSKELHGIIVTHIARSKEEAMRYKIK